MKTSDNTQRTLEHVIDSVADSYRLGRPIDSLESIALPNRRKIIDAISELDTDSRDKPHDDVTIERVELA